MDKLTPLMQQYMELKEKYNDCILMFRLGDFYEMFFEDAVKSSRELEIVLRGRDCGLKERAPMCGIPHHSVDSYINKLVNKGYKVAICEQLTDPKKSKGLVVRDVVRVITPGTIIEETMLDDKQNNYIASLYISDDMAGLAYSDVSTGGFWTTEFGLSSDSILIDELTRIKPRELIINEAESERFSHLKGLYYIQTYSNKEYANNRAYERLLEHFKVLTLNGFGFESSNHLGINASGALLSYLAETQKNALRHIRKLSPYSCDRYMQLDASTRMNLELTRPIRHDAGKKSTLLNHLDNTKTAMGARLLRVWVDQPLNEAERIERRLDAIDELFGQIMLKNAVTEALGGIYDIERLCSKIAYGTITPRDCLALKTSLEKLPPLNDLLTGLKSPAFTAISDSFDAMPDICELLKNAISDTPPLGAREGGIIRKGYNAEVDKFREASSNAKIWLAKMETNERERTGIKNLRIKYNKVFGYYIEVTKSYQHLVPYEYERRQTLANAERYTTPDLKRLQEAILGAEEKCIELEYNLFCEIRSVLTDCLPRLQETASKIAEVDAYQSMAQLASANGYCRPAINESGTIQITDGRHPVVERGMRDGFVPNMTVMDGEENRLLIITGPNMAGKSTYMRQVALIVLMAHIGSFVPARTADICIVDRIFTRVGASDNLSSGQSTFMVEMSEMANILNNATKNSLLILDEIGRGTSTYDGLSIAWAVLERIADQEKCGAKALFATHYHELTELEDKLPGVKNYRVSVREIGEEIIFLHKIVRGSADKSFGIQVARLAGLPDGVISRAGEILAELEASDISRKDAGAVSHKLEAHGKTGKDTNEVLDRLLQLDTNALTPIEALFTLNELCAKVKGCKK